MTALPDDFDLVEHERRADILIDRIAVDVRNHNRRRARSFTAREALMCLASEAEHVAVCASNLAQGLELSEQDRQRLWLASFRVTTIAEEAVG